MDEYVNACQAHMANVEDFAYDPYLSEVAVACANSFLADVYGEQLTGCYEEHGPYRLFCAGP